MQLMSSQQPGARHQSRHAMRDPHAPEKHLHLLIGHCLSQGEIMSEKGGEMLKGIPVSPT